MSFSLPFFCLFKQYPEASMFFFWWCAFEHSSELDFPPRIVWFHQQTSYFTNHSPLDLSQLLLVMLFRGKPQKISNLSQFNLLMNNSLCDPMLMSGWCSVHFTSHNCFPWWWKDWINMIKLKENSWALKWFQAM